MIRLRVLGIDPGSTGALAVVEGRRGERARLLEVIDVPMVGEKSMRRVEASPLLAFIQRHKPERAIIERAQAMPIITGGDEREDRRPQGTSSAFKYGGTFYSLIFGVEGMGVPIETCEVLHWKKTNGLALKQPKKIAKDNARHRASMLFGTAPFARVMDHNRAEACLIAWHGLQVFLSGAG